LIEKRSNRMTRVTGARRLEACSPGLALAIDPDRSQAGAKKGPVAYGDEPVLVDANDACQVAAKETLVRRRRIAPPITPKPPIIIAQDAGSGTDETPTGVTVSVRLPPV